LQTKNLDHETYLDTRELAELIRRKPESVRRLALLGKIPCRKPGGRLLFPLSEIQEWIDNGAGKTIDRGKA
jgi:hypothetical protein